MCATSSAAQDLSHLTLLFVFAHPDDEGFGSGGTLAMLASRGAKITLICATSGEVGEISDPALATPETLGEVRREELRRAMAVTGIKDVRFLHYRDSGMAGTEDNEHPDSLHRAEADLIEARLTATIRRLKPDAIITHDPTGGYGHPDHRAACRHATEAFRKAADAAESPLQVAVGLLPWQTQALYYVCFPRSNFQRIWRMMEEMNITPPFASRDIDLVGTPDEEVTTTLDVSGYVDTKIASLNCHRTQIDPNGPFAQLPEDMMREINGTEYYTLVSGEVDLLGQL